MNNTPAADNIDSSPAGGPLFVVFNLCSGAGNAAAIRSIIEDGCAAAGRELHLMSVDKPRRLRAIAADAARRARACNGILVAAGGDGTINAVAQTALKHGCIFGVLPQGTFNYFSRAHGIPLDTAQALRVLLQEQAHAVQVGLVNQRIFLVNASLGLYPQLLEDRENWKHYLGRNRIVAFGAAVVTLMGGHRSLRLQFAAPGARRKMRTPTLFVGNNALQLEQLGFSLASAIDKGELAGIVLKPVSRLAMLGLLLRGALRQLGASDRVLGFSFGELKVTAAWPFSLRRIKVATDGEVSWLRLPLTFRVAPTPLRLVRIAQHVPDTSET